MDYNNHGGENAPIPERWTYDKIWRSLRAHPYPLKAISTIVVDIIFLWKKITWYDISKRISYSNRMSQIKIESTVRKHMHHSIEHDSPNKACANLKRLSKISRWEYYTKYITMYVYNKEIIRGLATCVRYPLHKPTK